MKTDFIKKSVDAIKENTKGSIAIGPFGSRMKANCYVDYGIPVIRGTNLTRGRVFTNEFVYVTLEKADELSSCNVFKGDLVFPHRGAIGEVGIVLEERRYILSSSLMKLSCNRSIANPLFVYYFFKTKLGRHELLKNASQVGTPGIGQPLTSLRKIELPIPELKVQNEITNILGSLDDKIELNRRMNKTLEEMAQAIFKSWFVDFDPVKAKAAAKEAGKPPAEIERAAIAAISGKPVTELDNLSEFQRQSLAETAALFPDSFVPSELGVIPEGWESSVLADNVSLIMGQSPKSKFYNKNGHGLPFHQGVTNYGARFPFHKTFCTMTSRVAEKGDILFSVRAPVGRINIADCRIIIGRGLSALRHNNNLQSFLTYFLKHKFQREDIIGSGTIFNSVTKKDMQTIPFNRPSGQLAEAFDLIVTPLDAQIFFNDKQSQTLVLLRDTLLPKLLSGEISVAEAEGQTEGGSGE